MPKAKKKPAATSRKPRCLFCDEWTLGAGKILFTTDETMREGICQDCIMYMADKLADHIEEIIVESIRSTKH